MKILILVISLFTAFTALGASKNADSLKPLKETLDRIQKTKLSEFKIEKKVKSEVLGTEKTYQGKAFLSGALLRFETEKPDKSLVIYDGKTLWIVQYPDAELGGPIQVLRGKLQGKQKEQMLLTELLANGRLLKSFDVVKTGEESGVAAFEATPKDKKYDLKKVSLTVKDKDLKSLEYIDDVGNKTSLGILEQKSNSKTRPELFSYKPEKGAQVTDL